MHPEVQQLLATREAAKDGERERARETDGRRVAPRFDAKTYPTVAPSHTLVRMADPVGVIEIAQRLDVQDRTVHMWLYRGLLPPAEYDSINGSRAWEWTTILRWAGDTGRIPEVRQDLSDTFTIRFGHAPAPRRRAGVMPGEVATKPKTPKKAAAKARPKLTPAKRRPKISQ